MTVVQRKLFGTNGIRGVPGEDLSLEFVSEISQSIGSYFAGSGPVLVGHDVRNSSPAVSKAVTSGVLSSGKDGNGAALAPTPAYQFAVRKLGYDAGIIVTASHNPPKYNGIKVVGPDGVEISRRAESDIESIYFSKSYKKAEWRTVGKAGNETRVVENYIGGIMSQIDVERIRSRKFTVVLDIGNGAQAVAAPYLCDRLECKTISINGQADGNFPGRGPEPIPTVLGDLSEAVKSYHADFGVAYDGDGDRSLFCDENGGIYWGDRTGSLLVDFLLSSHPEGPIVTTVSTSQLVDEIASRHNAKVICTTVGSVDVSRAMINSSAPMGLEENGGFFYGPHIPVRDGAMTTALMLFLLASRQTSLSSALESLPKFYQKKAKFECPNESKKSVMSAIEKQSVEGTIDRTDGLKIWTDSKSWILLRPSGTEPLIRVYSESDEPSKLEAMYDKYQAIITHAIDAG